MIASPLASGDVLADRRAGYAQMLFESGDHAAAGDLMRDALALAPGWAGGWFRLGEMREAAGDVEAAAQAWREALRVDPSDRAGASLKLRLVGHAHAIDAAPSAFVETLFDQYADRFDVSLVGKLAYRVPELLRQALDAAGAKRFSHVVDIGCGTGLMAERLRAAASFIEGCDISAGMLRKAKEKGVYDRLQRSDLQVMEPGERRADLVTAADVLIYVGALERVVATVAAMTLPGGLFAFSVEGHDGPEPLLLRPSRRYAHSESYVRDVLAKSGFAVVSLVSDALRTDRGEPVRGLIVVARKTSAAMETAVAAMSEDGEERVPLN